MAPATPYLHDLLRRYEAGWALARQWCGQEQEIARLRAEIDRLPSLVLTAVDVPGRAERQDEAAGLRRGLDGR